MIYHAPAGSIYHRPANPPRLALFVEFMQIEKRKILLKKGLLSKLKCVSCHSQGKQPVKNIKIRKVENIMKTGKITAKLRDAVPVCLMVEGKEVKRYKNIELPDMLKEVEMKDFHFNVPADGKITFEIHYELGVLPEVFPEARGKVTRAEKAAAKAATETPDATPEQEETALAIIPEAPATEPETAEDTAAENEAAEESIAEASEPIEETVPAEESGTMEINYNVTGPRRKELATAIGEFIGMTPVYMKAPTYGFAISNYILDRNGTLRGEENKALVEALAAKGFTAA